MAPMLPAEATPLTYGMNVWGGHRIWSISANTKYPELCMEILNWLCTPEGKMVSSYGPQGVIWDYDAEGNTYFTEFGKKCMEDGYTEMTGEYAGYTYWDGFPQINNTTWSFYADNPDSNGETYHSDYWKSNIPEASCETEQAWREATGALTPHAYFKSGAYVTVPVSEYKEGEKSAGSEGVWDTVSKCITEGSWSAIYATSEEAFEQAVSKMQQAAMDAGYMECISWCEQEAVLRHEAEGRTGE